MPDDVKVLQSGDQAPDFELQDSTGALRNLRDLVSDGPRAFVFYRGHW
jgi:peroxiredoxin